MDFKPAAGFRMPQPLSSLKTQTPQSGKKPLRFRPLAALRPEDFKLNPAARGGIDMTAEPVRGREARRHLPGCTDPSCARCGEQLRVLAANLPITVGSSLWASSQDDLLTEDEKLIKYYLGDTFDQARVARMDSEQRENLITKARTQIISERHIRHRVKPNQRAKSPPGFWDIEFPTTQEVEAQREEADRREHAIVEDRHREAMREGGRWIFKDE